MHPSASHRFIAVRATVVGGIATLVGVLGHMRAGGGSPELAQLGVVWILCAAVSAVFLRRSAGWFRLAGLLLVEQVLVHTGLMAFAMSSRAAVPGMPGMPEAPAMSSMPGMTGMAGTSMTAMSPIPSARMVVMHAFAAAVVALWLWRGECAVARLGALARAGITLLWRPVLVAPAAIDERGLTLWADRLPLWGLRSARTVRRRGPPVACAF